MTKKFDSANQPDDEIEEILRQAAQEGKSPEVDFDALPAPQELDETDDIQAVIRQAQQQGISPEVDLEALPAPTEGINSEAGHHKKTRPMPMPPFSDTPPDSPAAPPPPPDPISKPTTVRAVSPPAVRLNDFWLLLPLFIMFRFLTLWLLKPGGFIRDWSDFDTYFGIAALSDYELYPFLNFWLEWPPILPWLAVGAYKLSLWLPPWPDDPRLWFVIILGSLFVLFEIGNFSLIYRLARRLFDSPATVNRVLWLYLGLFPPLYAMLGFFDCIALFFILLALELLLSQRHLLSAIAIGIGFMVKLLPLLILPVAVRRLWHQYRADNKEASIEIGLYVVVLGLTIMALLGPFLMYGPEWVQTSARAMMSRAPWETVWAIADGYYGYGVVLGDRLNPAETEFATHTSSLPWWLISLIFAGWYLLIIAAPADYNQSRPVIALTGFTTAMLLLYSKGYSPQFLVYLLPFVVLLFPNGRGLIYALILTGLNILEQPIYFVLIPSASWLLATIVISRFLLLLILVAEFLLIIWPHLKLSAGFDIIYRQTPTVLGSFALVMLLVLTPLIIQDYRQEQLDISPAETFINFMAAQTKKPTTPSHLILNDQQTYRQVYPYLHQILDIRLAGGRTQYAAAPSLTDLLADAESAWILASERQQQNLESFGNSLAVYEFTDLGRVSWYSLNRQRPPFEVTEARFTGGIELVAYDIEIGSEMAEVTLFWRAVSPQRNSFTAFTQMLNVEGQLIASHDGIPANGLAPTDNWPLNTIQMDRHLITLPATLPADGVMFIAGLYNSVGERLTVTAPNGSMFPDRAVPLTYYQ